MRRHRTARRALTLAVAATLVLGACATGPRPTWGDTTLPPAPTATGDPDIDAVLALLDQPSDAAATAEYSVLRKYGNTTTTARLAIGPEGRRAVTIGDVRFLTGPDGQFTCVDGTCSQGLEQQPISDLGVTIDFWAADTAARLRRDAVAKIGPVTVRSETIAEQAVECLDLPVSGGTAVYCVLPSGILALLDDGDVRIMLEGFSPVSLDDEFARP